MRERLDDGILDALARENEAMARFMRVSCERLIESKAPDQHLLYLAALAGAELAAARAVRDALGSKRLQPAAALTASHRLIRAAERRLFEIGFEPPSHLASPSQALRALVTPDVESDAIFQTMSGAETGDGDVALLRQETRRLAGQLVAPLAARIHNEDLDVPEEIISGLSRAGVFGLSIPEQYGGSYSPEHEVTTMLVVTEELSRASLGAAGSLATRPEILARALLTAGTEAQRRRWLPRMAAGDAMVAVAVTEPDVGSDVKSIGLKARAYAGGYRLTGAKTWCTFAGRADLLMVLARTADSERDGDLSVFVVEKPRFSGHEFQYQAPLGGVLTGRAIPTIGYRGMHSFELAFEDLAVPADHVVGESQGLGRGFQIQMAGFAAGRLQTAARATGLAQAAFEAAVEYATARYSFGRPIREFGQIRSMLASMASMLTAARTCTHTAARVLETEDGALEAAMAKVVASRAAEHVTRDAVQVLGAYGYAVESPVSRYFLDARVLSIFEGTEEVLAIRVIAPALLRRYGSINTEQHGAVSLGGSAHAETRPG